MTKVRKQEEAGQVELMGKKNAEFWERNWKKLYTSKTRSGMADDIKVGFKETD